MERFLRQPFFEILAPALWQVPAVFNSPHSGSYMPPEFLKTTVLSERELRQSEDCYVDELFSGCLDHGAPLLRALVSRAYLDFNREPFELDGRMFAESLPGFMNPGSPRVAAGFGTVPRYVGDGLEIYRSKLPLAEALARIENAYRPYHRALNALMNEARERAGLVLLLDCHSMPCQSMNGRSAADIVLGDRFGSSCSPDLISAIETYFVGKGLHVVRNRPYAGAFITSTYGAPQQGHHAIQIELNRALYMKERTLEKTPGFGDLKNLLSGFASHLSLILQEFSAQEEVKLAAE
jgi:N-formylglutamate amidohydrolase